ncbi:MAG: CRISPR-associated protein Cas4 [Limisphaerales bacterium]
MNHPGNNEEREAIPLSLLNDHLYCPRRAALKIVEGWRQANEHTARGDIVHEHADLPGYEVAKGVTLLRALPVWSERLGLSGKCDIVEVHPPHVPCSSGRESVQISATPNQSQLTSAAAVGAGCVLFPVEFKLGKRRQWENDDAQLCAQALCLEEMFGIAVPRGAIFHADSKRRREVEFMPELRTRTEQAIAELHALLAQSEISNLKSEIPRLPPAVWRPACEECSLCEICLPKATDADSRAKRLARELFEI